MAPFEERSETARRIANHPRIRVTGIERALGTEHTVDTLKRLTARFPDVRFVWIMGADNLRQISEWEGWRRIFETVPIAVFARPPYSLTALFGKAAHRFAASRVPETRAGALAEMRPPAWIFFHTRPYGASATRIRARRAAPAKAHERRRTDRDTTGLGELDHLNNHHKSTDGR